MHTCAANKLCVPQAQQGRKRGISRHSVQFSSVRQREDFTIGTDSSKAKGDHSSGVKTLKVITLVCGTHTLYWFTGLL